MKVVLLENIRKLGPIGTIVYVKNGYARNFLLPHIYTIPFNIHAISPSKDILHIDHPYRVPTYLLYMRSSKDNGELFEAVKDTDVLYLLRKFNVYVWRDQIYMATVFKRLGEHYVNITITNHVAIKVCIKVLRKG
ncbi:50S ribosomal L9 C-terminal domain-containing protein [Candidatus Tremblaya phenacola]|uniref:Large ribosomal subunit protein bL9 n=1 Tax=Candidatus Tremblayella phenacoccinincola TaxID=1010676 RepID=A0A2G0V732_9PROT|nr:50S ribosomal L9 C-terminal domain-containing protein [Candidatus Tremblaya phenacola]PHN16252.1 50S ribosomal protein L9 [Candidatus Tremblaya phenacola]